MKESVMQRVSFEMSYERKNTMESIMPNEKGELTVGSCRVVLSWHNSKHLRILLRHCNYSDIVTTQDIRTFVTK